MNTVPTNPITAGSIQVLSPIDYEAEIMKGHNALPIIPIALTHP